MQSMKNLRIKLKSSKSKSIVKRVLGLLQFQPNGISQQPIPQQPMTALQTRMQEIQAQIQAKNQKILISIDEEEEDEFDNLEFADDKPKANQDENQQQENNMQMEIYKGPPNANKQQDSKEQEEQKIYEQYIQFRKQQAVAPQSHVKTIQQLQQIQTNNTQQIVTQNTQASNQGQLIPQPNQQQQKQGYDPVYEENQRKHKEMMAYDKKLSQSESNEIQCICWQDEQYKHSRRVLIECTRCHKKQHRKCLGNKGELIIPYICPHCQLIQLDQIRQPVLTLVRPFKVPKIAGNNAMKQKLMMFCKKEFEIDERFERYLLQKHEVLFIEIRCVRLDAFENRDKAKRENFKQQWPNKGWFSFNYRHGREFVIPHNLNTAQNPVDDLTLAGIGVERARRDEDIFDVSAEVKVNTNFVEISQFDDDHTYACAVYVTKRVNIPDIYKHIRCNKMNSIFESYENLKRRVYLNEYFWKETINLRCPISNSRIKFMQLIIEQVNILYPLDFNLNILPRPEVIKILQREINSGETEYKDIDKNDLKTCTLESDLSVKIGCRTFILDDTQEPNQMIEFRADDPKSMKISKTNLCVLGQFRKDYRQKQRNDLKRGFSLPSRSQSQFSQISQSQSLYLSPSQLLPQKDQQDYILSEMSKMPEYQKEEKEK
eukprot:403334869